MPARRHSLGWSPTAVGSVSEVELEVTSPMTSRASSPGVAFFGENDSVVASVVTTHDDESSRSPPSYSKTRVEDDDDDDDGEGEEEEEELPEKVSRTSSSGSRDSCRPWWWWCCCCCWIILPLVLVVLAVAVNGSTKAQGGGGSSGSPESSDVSSTPAPSAEAPPHVATRNLFREAEDSSRGFWIPPQWVRNIEATAARTADAAVAAALGDMTRVASAVWITEKRRIRSTNSTGDLRGMLLDAAAAAAPPLVTVVLYDLPNRNCAAGVSTGELCCAYAPDGTCDFGSSANCEAGIDDYKRNFVDRAVGVLAEFDGVVPIAVIVEPDSLPNLATNLDDDRCGNQGTWRAYTEGVRYAVTQIATHTTQVAIYLDAAHGAWLGWQSGLESFADIVRGLDVIPHLRGFATNVANYQPLGVPCSDGAACLTTATIGRACCADPCGLLAQFNSANNEHQYARLLAATFAGEFFGGGDPHVVIDTGRNGAAEARDDCSTWCNPRDMRVGRSSSSYPLDSAIVDAYFWIKSPGYSDGCSHSLPSDGDPYAPGDSCPRFDSDCAAPGSLGTRLGEPYAPEAGDWFEYQVQMLAGTSHHHADYAPTSEPTPQPTYEPTYHPTPSNFAPSQAPSAPSRAPTMRPTSSSAGQRGPTAGPQLAPAPTLSSSSSSSSRAPTAPTSSPRPPTSAAPSPRPSQAPLPATPRPSAPPPTYSPTYRPTETCAAGWLGCATAPCCEGYVCTVNSDGYLLCEPDDQRTCRIAYESCTDDAAACCNGLTCYLDNEFYAACMTSCPSDWLCDVHT